jgi:hypothetical protein
MRNAMTRLALAGLAAGITACSGTGAAVPSPSPPATATAAPDSGSAEMPSSAAAASEAAAVTSYYRAIVARNYRRAFTYLAPKATGPYGQRLAWPNFLRLARTLDSESGPVTRFSFGEFKSMVVMTVNRKHAGPYHTHMKMTRSKNGWLIVSIDRI